MWPSRSPPKNIKNAVLSKVDDIDLLDENDKNIEVTIFLNKNEIILLPFNNKSNERILIDLVQLWVRSLKMENYLPLISIIISVIAIVISIKTLTEIKWLFVWKKKRARLWKYTIKLKGDSNAIITLFWVFYANKKRL